MLSIPAAWTTAMMRPGCEPSFLLNFELRKQSDGSTKNVKMVTGQRNLLGYPSTGHDVKSIAMKIDPIKRNFSINDVQISLTDDGYWRSLLQTYFANGKKVTVKLGCAELTTEGDWQSYGSVVIRDMRIEPGVIHLVCRDGGGVMGDAMVKGSWVSRHPLEALELILQDASISTSRYDATTLAASAYTTTHSHFRVTRADTRGPGDPPTNALKSLTAAKTLADELVFLVGGTWAPDHDDVWSYKDYDSAALTVADLTSADIVECRTVSTWDLMANRVGIQMMSLGDRPRLVFARDDSNSKTYFGEQGQDRIVAFEAESPWLNPIGLLMRGAGGSAISIPEDAGAGATFQVGWAHENGFCGVDHDTPISRHAPASPNALYDLSSARPGYLFIATPSGGGEIIKCDAVVSSSGVDIQWESTTSSRSHSEYGRTTTFQIAARAQFGTKQLEHRFHPQAGNYVVDYTIAESVCGRILNRFTSGAQVLEVTTSLDYFGVELGDLVRLTDDVPLTHGRDGVALNEHWEVVGKDVRVLDDSPRVVLTLCWASSVTWVHTAGFTEIVSPPPYQLGRGEPFFFNNGDPVELASNELVNAIKRA